MKRVYKSIMICGVSLVLTGGMIGCASNGADKKSTGEVIDDTAILTKVKAALINDPIIASKGIHVEVVRGVVTLTGAVNSEIERKKAQDITVGVNGVRSVENQIIVRQ